MDRNELLNSQVEGIEGALDGAQSNLWSAMPGIVDSVDLTANTCTVIVAIQAPINKEDGTTEYVDLPPLVDVPIVFPGAGGFVVTFPIAKGDEVLVIFASRCIDAWWQLGANTTPPIAQKPMEARMHDLSDAFAIPGPRSQPKKISAISATKIQIRNNAGTVFMTVGTKFSLTNAATDLKTVLTNLVNHIKAITTLNSDSTTGAVSAASQTVLNGDLTALGNLLE